MPQAFQLLLEQADIPCITVSGKMGSENHMWDLVRIDGQWLYFDPTSDRGRAGYGFYYCGVEPKRWSAMCGIRTGPTALCRSVSHNTFKLLSNRAVYRFLFLQTYSFQFFNFSPDTAADRSGISHSGPQFFLCSALRISPFPLKKTRWAPRAPPV